MRLSIGGRADRCAVRRSSTSDTVHKLVTVLHVDVDLEMLAIHSRRGSSPSGA